MIIGALFIAAIVVIVMALALLLFSLDHDHLAAVFVLLSIVLFCAAGYAASVPA